jgi:transposase
MATGNVVGVDPHRQTFTATVLDARGGEIDHAHFPNTTAGHTDVAAWARSHGPIERWGIEGASGLGRHLAEFLVQRDFDVRDVPPHKTSVRQRGRHEGKSDRLDSHRVAAETQTNPRLAHAFKHSTPAAPDATRDRISLWHNARKSLTKIRVQLLGELDALVHDLPEQLRRQLPTMKTVRARVNSLTALDTTAITDPTVLLRLQLINHRVALLRDVLEQDKVAAAELATLVGQTESTLTDIVGIAPRAAAEILVETGDIRRFTEAGFARFNGTAPIPATSGEGPDEPVRHRLSRGGNRRLNATIHRIAMIQLRYETRARTLHDRARANGHTRREAMRILKRHLSDAIYRTMLRDARQQPLLT